MRILFINHTGKASGAERVLLSMMERLDGHTMQLLCPSGELHDLAVSMGIECVLLDELHARFTWRPDHLVQYLGSIGRVAEQIRELVRRWQPDIIHANTVRAGIAATIATAGMRVPVIWHVHDILPRHPLSSIIRALFLGSRRTHAVCVSEATAGRFRQVLLRSDSVRRRIHVLHNGIDPAQYSPAAESELAHLRNELGLPGGSLVLAIVGQLIPRKGQLELIRALPHILTAVPGATLLVVGDVVFSRNAKYKSDMEAAISDLGLKEKVFLLGQRSDVADILRASDVLIVNSFEEPFGMVLLEAMACGRSVVSTRVGGVPEIIHDGRTGFLFNVGDFAQLTHHLADLAANPDLRTAVGNNARQMVASRFTIAIQVPRLLDIYRRVVGTFTRPGRGNAIAVGEEV